MFWEPFDYFESETYGKLSGLKKLASLFLSFPLSYMRLADYTASQRVDYFISNSQTVRKRVKDYYRRNSLVVYPFVDIKKIERKRLSGGDYFIVISRLLSWKKVDLAIKACNELHLHLKVIGEGPDLERLRSLSGPTIEFLGFVPEDEKFRYLKGCKALINTQLEDFGIVSLEAMACGRPVIAYGKGGVLETVLPSVTGEFFDKQEVKSLVKTLKAFDPTRYSDKECVVQAEKFDKENFQLKLADIVNVVYLESGQNL